MKGSPILPQEIFEQKCAKIPEQVMQAFNELIAFHFDGMQAKVSDQEFVDRILALVPGTTLSQALEWTKLTAVIFGNTKEWRVGRLGYNKQAAYLFTDSRMPEL